MSEPSDIDVAHRAAFHERERMRAGDRDSRGDLRMCDLCGRDNYKCRCSIGRATPPPCFEPREDQPALVGKLTAELHRATTINRHLCELLVNLAGELERVLDGERIDREIAVMMIATARRLKERCP